jgi:hypothetical protein
MMIESEVTEMDTLDRLKRQRYGREQLAESPAPVPAQWLRFDRHATKARA